LSPRCELILRRPEVELVEAITAALKAARNKWDLARLEVIAGRSLTHCLLPQALRNAGLAYDTLHRASLPILVINGSWEEYWRQLSYSGRRILARSRKKCRAAGALEVLRLNDPTGVAAWLNGLMDIADRSWKKPLGTDMRTRPENAAFYSDMLMRLAGAGGLAVWLLRINGFPAAMQICLRERDRVILMRSDFDEQFRSLEVGHALLGKVLEDCFALGLKEYDFGTQEYQYKRQFATRVDPMFAYEVYSGQTRLSGVRMAKKIMRRLRLLRQRMGIQGELLVRDVRPTEEEAKPMRLKTR